MSMGNGVPPLTSTPSRKSIHLGAPRVAPNAPRPRQAICAPGCARDAPEPSLPGPPAGLTYPVSFTRGEGIHSLPSRLPCARLPSAAGSLF